MSLSSELNLFGPWIKSSFNFCLPFVLMTGRQLVGLLGPAIPVAQAGMLGRDLLDPQQVICSGG